MKKVLLIGIGGVYNYGCEAIVRGTYNILKKVYPEVNVSYASYNYVFDKERLKDLDITILERENCRKWSIKNIIRKICSLVGIKYNISFDNFRQLKNFDSVFSIGGDIYTLNSDNSYNDSLPKFMSNLQKSGVKYILWGCSVGPFDSNLRALKFYRSHLKSIDAIIAREYETISYLRQIGVYDNVTFAPDPAFMVEGPSKNQLGEKSEKFTIGINLSPLSALYEYGSIENAIKEQRKIIEALIDKYDADIILLPHVLARYPLDNDLNYLLKIKDQLSDCVSKRVKIIDNDPGFIGIKEEIIKCDIVLAARMHCAINAICCEVPTLFISYSKKAIGMSEFVYGSENNVITLKDFTNFEILSDKIDKLISCVVDVKKIRKFNYKEIL